jgi:hypothetical protein
MANRGTWFRCAVTASAWGMLLALAACSAGHGAGPRADHSAPASVPPPASTADAPSASAVPGNRAAGPVAPLTGLPVPALTAQRPAVAVAVAGPDPVGLNAADLVYEDVTSPVRYLAVYQSKEANQVGPVTGTRPEDGPALSVMHPLTGYDGGTSSFVTVLDATKIIDAGYLRNPSLYLVGPDGVTVSTAVVAASGKSDGPPPALFSYRKPGDSLASAKETHPTELQVSVPGQPTERWSFDGRTDRWVHEAGGSQISVANLIVQIVGYKTVYLSRRYGETTQSARVTGIGHATVYSGTAPGGSGGTAAAGTWSKPGRATVTNFFDAANQPMNFTPGPTWVVLAPAGTQTSQATG